YPLEQTGQAAYDVHRNLHQGKVGVLALAPREGLGVSDHELREKHLDAINLFRDASAERTDKHSRDASAERTDKHSRDASAERTDKHSRDASAERTARATQNA
ncbi:crotonyl-CoA carboxylase/reductase, partial [Streptomyces sp. NPDC057545]